jgi:hypothetical protein
MLFLMSPLPSRIIERVAHVTSEGTNFIHWPNDLRGQVQIRNKQEALAFVRFFSSDGTWIFFPEFNLLELQPEGADRWRFATIPRSEWDKRDLPSLRVVKQGEEYRILRTVVRCYKMRRPPFRWEVLSIAIVDETVSSDGKYSLCVLYEERLPHGSRLVDFGLTNR